MLLCLQSSVICKIPPPPASTSILTKEDKSMQEIAFYNEEFTSSISHMTTLSMVLCLSNSLAVDPSPPPIIKAFLGL